MCQNLISYFELKLFAVLIKSALVLLARVMQLLSDLAIELLHFRSKILCSNTSDLIMFQVSQLNYSSWLHYIQYLEWALSSAHVW